VICLLNVGDTSATVGARYLSIINLINTLSGTERLLPITVSPVILQPLCRCYLKRIPLLVVG
jgi:hypothetical protein